MEEQEEMQVANEDVPVVLPTDEAVEPPTVDVVGGKPGVEEIAPAAGDVQEGEVTAPVAGPEPEAGTPDAEENAWDAAMNRLGSLEERLAATEVTLGGRMDALQKAVSGMYTQTTDSMHRELEKYRKGMVRKLEQELFGELIELYDAAERGIARAAENPEKAVGALEGIRDQIDTALFNRGVEKREAIPGEAFDGRRHHATGPAVPTGNAALDGTVAATAKAGFDDVDESFKNLRGGCMRLRPVWVRLHKYDSSLAVPTETVPTEAENIQEASVDSGKSDAAAPAPSEEA